MLVLWTGSTVMLLPFTLPVNRDRVPEATQIALNYDTPIQADGIVKATAFTVPYTVGDPIVQVNCTGIASFSLLSCDVDMTGLPTGFVVLLASEGAVNYPLPDTSLNSTSSRIRLMSCSFF
jgi:hypothetical protein